MTEASHNPTEVWRVIVDFPQYAVSSIGRVRRLVEAKNGQASWPHHKAPPKPKRGKAWMLQANRGTGQIYFGPSESHGVRNSPRPKIWRHPDRRTPH